MKTKTIPTILGLLVTVVTTILGGYLIEKTKGPINVSAQEKPLSVKITNITNRSFVVSWYTQSPTLGYIKIDNNKLFWDQRDQGGSQPDNYFTHHIIVNDLQPKTQYSFTIFSGDKPYQDNSFKTQTAPLNSNPSPEADLAFGIILDQQKNPLPGVLVFLSIANATPLSSITNESGNWSISLGTAYKKDLSGFITYDKNNQIIEITAVSTPNLSATAITNTGNDHPVPPITIGQSFDFSTKLSPSPKPSLHPSPTLSPTLPALQPVSISTPREGENLTDTKPEFRGLGPAQEKIHLKLKSPTTYAAEVMIEPDGTWSWTPPQNLEPGKHTLTLEYTDKNNQRQSLLHHFTVQAAETISPTPTPITPLPTRALTPTPTITLAPTSLPTTPFAQETTATPTAQIVTGNLTPLLLLAIFSISLITIAFII